jgi:F-type H+-transporting ATPase subunit delta
MSEIRVAARYAKSLYDLAIERNLLEKVEQDAIAFLDLCHSNRAFTNMLKSPIVHLDKKWHILDRAFTGKFSPLTMEFFKIVLRKKRDHVLPDIFRQYMEMFYANKNIIKATVYSAVPLSETLKTEIQSFLAKRTQATIELRNEINSDLLGGFVLKYEDKLVDASVSTQLRTLRTNLINAN